MKFRRYMYSLCSPFAHGTKAPYDSSQECALLGCCEARRRTPGFDRVGDIWYRSQAASKSVAPQVLASGNLHDLQSGTLI